MVTSAENNPTINLPTRSPEECAILIVDDDERIVEVLSVILEREGYQIRTAMDGHTALRMIKEQALDIAIVDVIMPGLDGIEVCRQVKDNPETHFLPVILVTGATERSRRIDGLYAGADEFVNKPVDPVELIARVRSLLRTKQLNDQVLAHRRELEQRISEATEELRAAYDRLRELSRVKSNVLTLVSHELRTPLIPIKSAMNLVKVPDLSLDKRESAVKMAEEAFNRLEYRIGDIEAFSGPSDDLNLSATSVVDLLHGAIEQVRVLRRGNNISVDLVIPKNLVPVMVDAKPMTRALAHIIDNAVKFGNDKPVKVEASSVDDHVKITVKDNGIGIPKKLIPHLFEPLRQGDDDPTRRRHEGLGIGLALVKVILDAHEVEIGIKSKVNQGTTITLALPVANLS